MKSKIIIIFGITFLILLTFFPFKSQETRVIAYFVVVAIFLIAIFIFRSKNTIEEVKEPIEEEIKIGHKKVLLYADAKRLPGEDHFKGIVILTEEETGKKVTIEYSSIQFFLFKDDIDISLILENGERFSFKGKASDVKLDDLGVEKTYMLLLSITIIPSSIINAVLVARARDMLDSINPFIWIYRPSIEEGKAEFSTQIKEEICKELFN